MQCSGAARHRRWVRRWRPVRAVSIMASVERAHRDGDPAGQDQAATPPTATGSRPSPATPRSSRSRPGLSRIAGLVREIVASSYFATSGAFSAFTIAFQVPNLVRSLFADAALSAAFVPVFTELLEQGQPQGGLPARLDAVLPDPRGARRDHRAVHRRRPASIMPLFTGRQVLGASSTT